MRKGNKQTHQRNGLSTRSIRLIAIAVTITVVIVLATIISAALVVVVAICPLLYSPATHSCHLTSERIFLRVRDIIFRGILLRHGGIFDLELKKGRMMRAKINKNASRTYHNFPGNILANKGVTDNVQLPGKHANVGRALELDLVRAVITFRCRLRVWNIGDLDRRDDEPVRLVIGQNDPPGRFASSGPQGGMSSVGRHGRRRELFCLDFGSEEFFIKLFVLLDDALGFVDAELGLGGWFDTRG